MSKQVAIPQQLCYFCAIISPQSSGLQGFKISNGVVTVRYFHLSLCSATVHAPCVRMTRSSKRHESTCLLSHCITTPLPPMSCCRTTSLPHYPTASLAHRCTVPLAHCHTAQLSHCFIIPLPHSHCPIVPLYNCLSGHPCTFSLPHHRTASLYRCLTLLLHCLTISLPNYPFAYHTTSVSHWLTIPLPNYHTTSVFHCLTISRPNNHTTSLSHCQTMPLSN
jgi:hypothetical protein